MVGTLAGEACKRAREDLCNKLDDAFYANRAVFNNALNAARANQGGMAAEAGSLNRAGCGKFNVPNLIVS